MIIQQSDVTIEYNEYEPFGSDLLQFLRLTFDRLRCLRWHVDIVSNGELSKKALLQLHDLRLLTQVQPTDRLRNTRAK